jgi:hypothetical protein
MLLEPALPVSVVGALDDVELLDSDGGGLGGHVAMVTGDEHVAPAIVGARPAMGVFLWLSKHAYTT